MTRTSDDVRLKPDAPKGSEVDAGLQPWQFFLLAGLGCATAITFLVRGQGVTVVVLVTALMGATALVGLAALRAVKPLVGPQEDRTVVVGERTRAALERDKTLTLRAIKDLEFDRAMGKLSEEDFREMGGRLRARAGRIIKQLDAGASYRDQIERDLAKRLGPVVDTSSAAQDERTCPACATSNDLDAKFCKQCGARF